MKWQIREGLLAYVELVKEAALEAYKFECLMYAQGAKAEKPVKPRILGNG